MGAVDQVAYVRRQFWLHGIPLNAQSATRLHFTVANGNEAGSHEEFTVPNELLHVIVTFQVLNAPGLVLLGEEVHEPLALVVDHSAGEGVQQGDAEDICGSKIASMSTPHAGCLFASNHNSSVGSLWSSRVLLRRFWSRELNWIRLKVKRLMKFPCRSRNNRTQQNTSDSKHIVSTDSLAIHIDPRLINIGTLLSTSDDEHDDGEDALNTDSRVTSTSGPLLLAASTAANNDTSMSWTTDGSV